MGKSAGNGWSLPLGDFSLIGAVFAEELGRESGGQVKNLFVKNKKIGGLH